MMLRAKIKAAPGGDLRTRLPRDFPDHFIGGEASPGPSYALPDSFEALDVWTNAWAGNKGSPGWSRVSGGASQGSWRVRMTGLTTPYTIYSPYYQFAPGQTIGVDLKIENDNWTENQTIGFMFGRTDAASYYRITIDSFENEIRLYRISTLKATWAGAAGTSWKTLKAKWDADGKITVYWGAGTLGSWTDPSPLPGRLIGVFGKNLNPDPHIPSADNIRLM